MWELWSRIKRHVFYGPRCVWYDSSIHTGVCVHHCHMLPRNNKETVRTLLTIIYTGLCHILESVSTSFQSSSASLPSKFQDLASRFPGLSRTKVIFQDFLGHGNIPIKIPGISRTFQEAWEPCVKIQCNTCHQMASLAFILYKIQFWPGLFPEPHWGAYNAPPDSLVSWEGDSPSSFPTL